MNVGACGQAVRLFYQDFFDYSDWQVLCCRVRPLVTGTGWAKWDSRESDVPQRGMPNQVGTRLSVPYGLRP